MGENLLEIPATFVLTGPKRGDDKLFKVSGEQVTFKGAIQTSPPYKMDIIVFLNSHDNPGAEGLILNTKKQSDNMTILEIDGVTRPTLITSYADIRNEDHIYLSVTDQKRGIPPVRFHVRLKPKEDDFAVGMMKIGFGEDRLKQRSFVNYRVTDIAAERAYIRLAQVFQ